MWPTNALTERLGIRYPIIGAPMAGASTPALAAAVSNAGGLGSLGLALASPEAAGESIAETRAATNGAFNANFFCHDEPTEDAARDEAMRQRLQPYFDELELGEVPAAALSSRTFGEAHLEMVLAMRPPVVTFHFGLPPADLVQAVREADLVIGCSATNVAEAKSLEAAGVDFIIAQGFEAGGHRGTFAGPAETGHIGTFALVPQVVGAVSVPVVAAGGIADGRGIAAAFALGALGVQPGTAFLACPETQIGAPHVQALRDASADQTRLTAAFSGRQARGIENRYMREMASGDDVTAPFPIPNTLTGPLRKGSATAGSPDFMSLWAGQAFPLNRAMPAADLVQVLIEETEAVFAKLGR